MATASALLYLVPLLNVAPGTAVAGGYSGGSGGINFGQYGNGPAGGLNIGGGFGGGGGHGYGTSQYGPTYGDLLAKLEGGSGGSGGSGYYNHGKFATGGGGGGGGGSIEINAQGRLTLAGILNASGGSGGFGLYSGSGGAGGGVLLSGSRVVLATTGQVNADGGNSGFTNGPTQSGGAGGGGRITIQTFFLNSFTNNGALNVNGGQGSLGLNFDQSGNFTPYISNGGNGVITVIATAVPEPGAGSLLVAILGAVPVVAALRKRRK